MRSPSAKGARRGSSPRTRRTHFEKIKDVDDCRFISAHAENTNAGLQEAGAFPVHLRARGEHTRRINQPVGDSGSSPRTRRTPIKFRRIWGSKRFISAHAENTANFSISWPQSSVHLRARGEHLALLARGARFNGSSPRTRRTPDRRRRCPDSGRFISAHAENTDVAKHRVRRIRFISAHAENTNSPDPKPIVVTVHLRARGEHFTGGAEFVSVNGSSPRTRRTRVFWRDGLKRRRFISAHAENTVVLRANFCGSTVDLRARGEHSPSGETSV